MTWTKPARTPPRSTGLVVAAALLGVAALLAAAVNGNLASAAPAADDPASPSNSSPPGALAGVSDAPATSRPASPAAPPRAQGPIGVADGLVPDGTTVFDSGIPAIAKLDPALLRALRRAATDAARGGVTFYVDSGWRSARYQQALLQRAIAQYGSPAEAARWVATPTTSAHVTGDAVDLGRADATAWLARHGAAYGLCQIYQNEPWHYELRPDAITQGCPPLYADASQDPRLEH